MTTLNGVLSASHSPHPEAAPWEKVFIGEIKTFPCVPFLKCLRNRDERLLSLIYNLETVLETRKNLSVLKPGSLEI